MEKLEAIFSEIEMHDKGLTGTELKRRALFLDCHLGVTGATMEPETLAHQATSQSLWVSSLSIYLTAH